jgi:hypothetical protein
MKQKCYEINVMVRDFIIINFQVDFMYTEIEEGKLQQHFFWLAPGVHRHRKITVIFLSGWDGRDPNFLWASVTLKIERKKK